MRKILLSCNIHETQMLKTQVTNADQEQNHFCPLKVGMKNLLSNFYLECSGTGGTGETLINTPLQTPDF